MQRGAANGPECLAAWRTQTAGTRHQRFLTVCGLVRGAFAGGLFLAITYRFRLACFSFGTGFGGRLGTGNAVTQTGFVGAQFTELLLALLNGGFQPGEGFLTFVTRLFKLRLLGALFIQQRLLLTLLLFQFGTLGGDLFASLLNSLIVSWRAWFR